MGEREERAEQLADMAAVLNTDAGRRVVRRFLSSCKPFGSVVEPVEMDNGLALKEENAVFYRAGRQDLGHFWMAELGKADPVGFRKMHDEAFEKKLREEVEKGKRKPVEESDV